MGSSERAARSVGLSSVGKSGGKCDGPGLMGPLFGGTHGWLTSFPPKLRFLWSWREMGREGRPPWWKEPAMIGSVVVRALKKQTQNLQGPERGNP